MHEESGYSPLGHSPIVPGRIVPAYPLIDVMLEAAFSLGERPCLDGHIRPFTKHARRAYSDIEWRLRIRGDAVQQLRWW